MMLLDKWAVALALTGALAAAGCGKSPTESQPPDSEPAVPAAAQAQPPRPPAEPTPGTATKETLSGAAEFQRKSLASPFAQAELALRESFNRALIAYPPCISLTRPAAPRSR